MYQGWTEPPEQTEQRHEERLRERLAYLAEQECECQKMSVYPWRTLHLCDRCREINQIEDMLGIEAPF